MTIAEARAFHRPFVLAEADSVSMTLAAQPDGSVATTKVFTNLRGIEGKRGQVRVSAYSTDGPRGLEPIVEVEGNGTFRTIRDAAADLTLLDIPAGEVLPLVVVRTLLPRALTPGAPPDPATWSIFGNRPLVMADEMLLEADFPPAEEPAEWGACSTLGTGRVIDGGRALDAESPCSSWRLEPAGPRARLIVREPLPGVFFALRWRGLRSAAAAA